MLINNSVIAHNTFTENDDYQLKDNDIVRIELCHIDNNIVSVGKLLSWNEIGIKVNK